ncbi:hypothetical protein [Devosia sp.]|uniref:hypothetical protein n=1 Tax=Devosia sp. TaxID=1871048 RepID=UPI0019FEB683|nr:hypothetical protein [Devosia sp.]MBE0578493.1 hypothetical protein [Devosia sp.]
MAKALQLGRERAKVVVADKDASGTTAQLPDPLTTTAGTDAAASGGSFTALTSDSGAGQLQNDGGGGAHNNLQPTFILNKIIYAGA